MMQPCPQLPPAARTVRGPLLLRGQQQAKPQAWKEGRLPVWVKAEERRWVLFHSVTPSVLYESQFQLQVPHFQSSSAHVPREAVDDGPSLGPAPT